MIREAVRFDSDISEPDVALAFSHSLHPSLSLLPADGEVDFRGMPCHRRQATERPSTAEAVLELSDLYH
jgi:hypothetical protein